MQKVWRIAGSFWRAVLAVGALLGILYLPQDIGDLPTALQRWGPIVNLFTREIALIVFSAICAAWIVWIDIRPFSRQQIARWRGREQDSSTLSDSDLRILIKERLGEALEKGKGLIGESQSTIDRADLEKRMSEHLSNTYNFIETALGKGEAILSNNAVGITLYSGGNKPNWDLRNGIQWRLQRITELLRRLDTVPIVRGFTGASCQLSAASGIQSTEEKTQP